MIQLSVFEDAPANKRNDGKEAEGIVHSALKVLETKHHGTFLRLYDTTSARGLTIPEQPGDFVLILSARPCLIEVKSSVSADTLTALTLRNVFSPSQMLGARLWHRSGAATLTLYHKVGSRVIQLWNTLDISNAYYAPPRKRKLTGPLFACSSTKDEDLAFAIKSFVTTKI